MSGCCSRLVHAVSLDAWIDANERTRLESWVGFAGKKQTRIKAAKLAPSATVALPRQLVEHADQEFLAFRDTSCLLFEDKPLIGHETLDVCS